MRQRNKIYPWLTAEETNQSFHCDRCGQHTYFSFYIYDRGVGEREAKQFVEEHKDCELVITDERV